MFKILSRQSKSVTGAAIIIGAASFVTKIIALMRDRLFAHYFGAGDIMDAYYAAFKIPDIVYNLLVIGALSAGFIPIFIELLDKDKKHAWKMTNAIINILGISLIIICSLLIVFTPQLMHAIVPGFAGEKFDLTVKLTRIMFLSPILLGISSVVSGVLQSFKSFFIYSLTPIMYNLGIILGVLVLVPIFGIAGLAYGVILGAILHLLIQIPEFFKHGFHFEPVLMFKDTYVRKIGWLMIPRTLGLASRQINFLAITIIASTLAAGSISIFNFADNLQYVPVSITGAAFAVALFPTLSKLAHKKNYNKMSQRIAETTRQILFFVIPMTIILILLRAQIVRVVLGTGEFDWEATLLTANALAIFAISLFAQALIPLLAKSFYALQDTMTPFLIGVVSTVLNIFLAIYMSNEYGILGLIAAYSFSMLFQGSLLWIFLRHKLETLEESKIIITILKISIAALFMGLTIQVMKYPIAHIVDMQKFWGILIQGALSGTMGILVYGFIASQLKLREMRLLQASFKKRWLKLRTVQTDIPDNR